MTGSLIILGSVILTVCQVAYFVRKRNKKLESESNELI